MKNLEPQRLAHHFMSFWFVRLFFVDFFITPVTPQASLLSLRPIVVQQNGALTGFSAPISKFLSPAASTAAPPASPSPVAAASSSSPSSPSPAVALSPSISSSSSPAVALSPISAPSPVKSSTPGEGVYVVKNGDYADLIATRHGMTLDELRKLNPLNGTLEVMHIGDILKIRCPATGCISDTPKATAKLYVVKAGDTAADIAKQNGFLLEQLRLLNPSLGTMDMIRVGDSVVVGDTGGGTPSLGDVYVVQPGDFAGKIATRFGMTLDELVNLNPDKGTMDLIKIGDLVKLKPGSLTKKT